MRVSARVCLDHAVAVCRHGVQHCMLKHWIQPLHNEVRLPFPNTSCAKHLHSVEAQTLGVGLQLPCASVVPVKDDPV